MTELPKRFADKVDFSGDCWIWKATKNDHGYGQYFYLGRLVYAHRFSWEFFNRKEIPDGYFVLHRCDNPPCVNPEHLSIGTHKDNMVDMMVKGRHRFVTGEKVGSSKFTQAEIDEIRKLYATGNYSQRALARKIGISSSHVHYIVNNRIWIS